MYTGGLGRDCEHGDFNDLMCTVQPGNTPAMFCRQLTVLGFLCFCVSPVKESQNDALTKVAIIGEEQIIKSLVNADCCLGLCLMIPIEMTSFLKPLFLSRLFSNAFCHVFATF